MLFFNYQTGSSRFLYEICCKSGFFSDESEETVGGGEVVYTIKNEDDTVHIPVFVFRHVSFLFQLLRVIPEDNSLNLIYREDDKVLKFNKYVNHRQADKTFYEFCACYLDLDKLKLD